MNNDVWIDCDDLEVARYRASACKFNDTFVYLFGGCTNFEVDPFTCTIERFNAETSTSKLLEIKLPKECSGTICLQNGDNSILVLGGYKFTPRKDAYELDVSEGKWKTMLELKENVSSIFPPQVNNGKVVIFGSDDVSDKLPKVVEY